MTPILIGLAGKMRTGKDTIHEILARPYWGYFERVAYGDELKRRYSEQSDYSENSKDRKGLQIFGQSEREKDPKVWVKPVEVKLEMLLNHYGRNVVITDVRQPNEVEQIREWGGYLIRVNVKDEIRLARMNANGDKFKLEDLQHETELYIDGFDADYELDNNEGFKELNAQVDAILADIIEKETSKAYARLRQV